MARGQFGVSEHGDAGSPRFGGRWLSGRIRRRPGATSRSADEHAAQAPAGQRRSATICTLGAAQYFVNLDNYTPGVPGSYKVGPVGDLRYPYGSNQGYVVIGNQVFRGDGAIYTPGRFLQNDGYSVGG